MRFGLLISMYALAVCAYPAPIRLAVTSGFSHNFAEPLHIFSNGYDLFNARAQGPERVHHFRDLRRRVANRSLER